MGYFDTREKKSSNWLNYLMLALTLITLLIWVLHLNHKLFLLINAWHIFIPVKILSVVNVIAAPRTFILPLILVVLTLIFRLQYLKKVVIAIISFYVLFYLLKLGIHEARPFVTIALTTMFLLPSKYDSVVHAYMSFPSGHTGLTTLFVCILAAIFRVKNKLIGTILFLLPVAVGLTRIMTGWHWPLDVVISSIIAYVLFLIVFVLFRAKN